MTILFSGGDDASKHLVSETMEQYRDAAEAFALAIRDIRQGRYDGAKEAALLMKELRLAFHSAMDERTRVEKLDRQAAGIVHDYALDFDAARAEIGRRLARLRDGGGG